MKVNKQLLNNSIIKLANNLKMIALLYIVSLLVGAVLFAVFEHRSLTDGLWWAPVTSLTIGYGDVTPLTLAGRILGVLMAHFWIFGIAPLIVANIILRVARDSDEYTHGEQEWLQKAVQALADERGISLEPPPSDTNFGDVLTKP